MSAPDASSADKKRLAVVVAVLVMLFPLGYSVGSYLLSPHGTERARPLLEMPDPRHKACVEDTEYMRFHHMDYIKEMRDAGVRRGALREISLASCRECHTSRERFCTRCHAAVDMSPDCFECHYYP